MCGALSSSGFAPRDATLTMGNIYALLCTCAAPRCSGGAENKGGGGVAPISACKCDVIAETVRLPARWRDLPARPPRFNPIY